VALANLLNRSLPLSFYTADPGAKASAYNLLLQSLSKQSSALHKHITQLPDHDADVYLDRVFTSLFTGHLALDQAARLWDVYVFEGDSVLVRAGVALLLRKELPLLASQSMEDVKAVLGGRQDEEPAVLSRHSDEDAWMRSVREAGRI
jgi:Rab-GTPase-TBC domain-containing protein